MNAALHTEADAVTRLAAARPLVVDVVPASEVSAHHAAGGPRAGASMVLMNIDVAANQASCVCR